MNLTVEIPDDLAGLLDAAGGKRRTRSGSITVSKTFGAMSQRCND
jgi:hypothetical protein